MLRWFERGNWSDRIKSISLLVLVLLFFGLATALIQNSMLACSFVIGKFKIIITLPLSLLFSSHMPLFAASLQLLATKWKHNECILEPWRKREQSWFHRALMGSSDNSRSNTNCCWPNLKWIQPGDVVSFAANNANGASISPQMCTLPHFSITTQIDPKLMPLLPQSLISIKDDSWWVVKWFISTHNKIMPIWTVPATSHSLPPSAPLEFGHWTERANVTKTTRQHQCKNHLPEWKKAHSLLVALFMWVKFGVSQPHLHSFVCSTLEPRL